MALAAGTATFAGTGLAAWSASDFAAVRAFSPPFAGFFSLPLPSLAFGGSLIQDSLRKIFSRSSGVLPLPFSCMANI